MIKRFGSIQKRHEFGNTNLSEDDNDNENENEQDTKDEGSDNDLSDFDENQIDKELGLKNIDKELKKKYKNLPNVSKHEIGREKAKLIKKQEKYKKEMNQIIESNLEHKNERPRKTKYTNYQRTLIFGSRGINQRMRHLMQDLRDLIVHSKSESKFENKRDISSISDICELRNCNNCIYFESRRNTDLYLWMSRVPNGPSMKFYVSNVHTMAELKLTGNCLKGGRAILIFDKKFDDTIEYKLMKSLFSQIFGIPNGHPKSKAFIDHAFSFMILDNKIWFRNYQIVYNSNDNTNENSLTEPILVEIGPRFVLHPIRIQRSCFKGSTIYQNEHFINPNAHRRAVKRQKQLISANDMVNKNKNEKNPYLNKVVSKILKTQKNKEIKKLDFDKNKLQSVFDEGSNFGFEQTIIDKQLKNAKKTDKNEKKKEKKQDNENENENEKVEDVDMTGFLDADDDDDDDDDDEIDGMDDMDDIDDINESDAANSNEE